MALPDLLRKRARIGALYRQVFEAPGGAEVLADLLREAGLLEVSSVAGDPSMTHFRDGKRAVGLHVINRMRWTEAQLLELARRQTDAGLRQEEEGAGG